MQLKYRRKTMKNCEYCKQSTDIMYFDKDAKMFIVECEGCYIKRTGNKKKIIINNMNIPNNQCSACNGVGRIIIDFMNLICGKCNGMGYILTKKLV